MKANDLRVTNFVTSDRITMPIAMIGIDSVQLFTPQGNVIQARLELIKPIPLTGEWVLKYKPQLDKWYLYLSGSAAGGFLVYMKKDDFYLLHLKYVHQLQNLYFALTGEELKLQS